MSLHRLSVRAVPLLCLLAMWGVNSPAKHAVAARLVSSPHGGRYVPAATAGLDRGWQYILLNKLTRPQAAAPVFSRLVAGGPGLVAMQQASHQVWVSNDGRTWRRLPSPAFRRSEFPLQLYAAGRLVIIASSIVTDRSFHIWTFRDGGATWRESRAHFRITALAAGGDGAIAFSQTDVSQPITVWTSVDGLTWRRLPQRPGVFATAEVLSVARGVHGFIAGGYIGPPRPRAGIWTSPDGRTWKLVPNRTGIFSNVIGGPEVNDVATGPRGMLAISDWRSWASPDGVHWRRGPALFTGQNGLGHVIAWQGGFVQLINEGGETAVWSSADGVTWTRRGSDGLFGGSARINSAVSFNGGIVAVGSFAFHPRPACLKSPKGAFSDLRAFQPAAFLWSPAASALARPATVDASDPQTFKLLPSDGIGGRAVSSLTQAFSAYVDLCAADSALGPHRAFSLGFAAPRGGTFADTAFGIVTASLPAAGSAFHHAARLLPMYGEIQHQRELPVYVRIGEQTRVFSLQIHDVSEGAGYTYTKFVVAWRKGLAVGIVTSYFRHDAVVLAERQLAHLEHPVR